jgi:hypothetical protein
MQFYAGTLTLRLEYTCGSVLLPELLRSSPLSGRGEREQEATCFHASSPNNM